MKSIEIIREKKFIVILLLLLLIGFVYIMKPFLMAMILAGIIVLVFYPVFVELCDRIGQRRRLASVIMTFLILTLLIIPTALIGSILLNQVYQYINDLNLKGYVVQLFTTDFYTTHVAPFLFELEDKYQIKIDIFGILSNLGKQIAHYVGSFSPVLFLGTMSFLFNFLIMITGIYFLFLDGPALTRTIFDLTPLRDRYEKSLVVRIRNTIDASIYGYLVTGLMMGVVAGIVFAITGIKAYLILATLTFFMSVVPIVGAAGVWVPVCLYLLFTGDVWQGFVVILGGAVITFIDYFLKPMIIKGKTQIHPILIFFSLFGGISVFGILGILFGPVITALLIAVIRIYQEEFI
ncbi:MAG: AI-2E family transporter [bacterium]|nr:AI-2E family transporter [bacterium]MBU1918770.1 AI-2E family transporter [bacterium]